MMKKSAFQRAMRDHRDRLFGYTFYFLRHREDAEDAVQEVFVKLWEHWDRIDKGRMVAWMMRVAHNVCVDAARRRKSVRERERAVGMENVEFSHSNRSIDGDPEARLELTETQKCLLAAMDTLPEKTKSMMLLHYYQGLKYEEIGEVLDEKAGTVKVAVHRGRKTLKDVLAKQLPEQVGEG
jgi:RNA polymerase sigma-70 factor (ECF subfamily)